MRPTAKVDLAGFDQSVRALARLGKTTIDEVLPWQVASAVKRAMNRCPVLSQKRATYKAIRESARESGLLYDYKTKRQIAAGEVHKSTTDSLNLKDGYGRTWHKLNRSDGRTVFFAYNDNGFTSQKLSITGRVLPEQYRPAHDAKVSNYKKLLPVISLRWDAARYAPKKSFLDIIDDIGKPVELVAPKGSKHIDMIRKAVASNGRKYKNGNAIIYDGKSSLTIEVINSFPALDVMQFRRLMAYGVNAVAKQTKKDFEKNFFDNAKRTAARYPFLKVS